MKDHEYAEKKLLSGYDEKVAMTFLTTTFRISTIVLFVIVGLSACTSTLNDNSVGYEADMSSGKKKKQDCALMSLAAYTDNIAATPFAYQLMDAAKTNPDFRDHLIQQLGQLSRAIKTKPNEPYTGKKIELPARSYQKIGNLSMLVYRDEPPDEGTTVVSLELAGELVDSISEISTSGYVLLDATMPQAQLESWLKGTTEENLLFVPYLTGATINEPIDYGSASWFHNGEVRFVQNDDEASLGRAYNDILSSDKTSFNQRWQAWSTSAEADTFEFATATGKFTADKSEPTTMQFQPLKNPSRWYREIPVPDSNASLPERETFRCERFYDSTFQLVHVLSNEIFPIPGVVGALAASGYHGNVSVRYVRHW